MHNSGTLFSQAHILPLMFVDTGLTFDMILLYIYKLMIFCCFIKRKDMGISYMNIIQYSFRHLDLKASMWVDIVYKGHAVSFIMSGIEQIDS